MRETRKAWRASVRERREQRMIELLQAKVSFAEYARVFRAGKGVSARGAFTR